MSSKLLINVNDASPSVVPDTSAPDTGMFSVSHTDGADNLVSMVLPIIGIAILVIAIFAIIITATIKRKKVNHFTTHTNKHLLAKLTALSVVVLLGVLGVMNMDKITSMVSATTGTSGDDDTLTITASDIKIDVDLNDTAVFATGESVVTVDSATEAGYTLMAYVDSTATDLKNETNKTSTSTITMLNTTDFKNPTALTNNTWGIATTKPTSQDSTVFTGLPTTLDTAMTLKTTDEATTANDKSTFYYSTYVTPGLDYGTYSGTTITYIAIANYAGPCNPNATTIQEAKCLQDFAGPNRDQIVESMTPETQYTLMDMRDEKTYTIAKYYAYEREVPKSAKLKPQTVFQVWMTQNLDLDLDSNTTYTNEDTDLGYNPETQQYETATWIPSLSTYTTNNTTWRVSNTTPESYDPGNIYWNGRDSDVDLAWNDYYRTCSWDSSNKPYNCDETINPISDVVSPNGIPQYHLGNYYNWTAAVAMNDSSGYYNDFIAEQSICPAGWTLPRAWNDSFQSLWNYYGFEGGWQGSTRWGEDDEFYKIWEEPLFVPATGGWYGSLGYVGLGGSFWAAMANDEYSASFDGVATYVYTSTFFGEGRGYGFSVRCIARPVSSFDNFPSEDY